MTTQQTNYPILRVWRFIFPFGKTFETMLGFQERVVVAIIAYIAVRIYGEIYLVNGANSFNWWAISSLFYPLFLLSVFCYLFSKVEKNSVSALLLYSVVVEIWVLTFLISLLLWGIPIAAYKVPGDAKWFYVIFHSVASSAIAVILYQILNHNLYQVKGHILSYIAIVVFPFAYFNIFNIPLWYQAYPEQAEERWDIGNYDDLLLRQYDMVDDDIELLANGKAGEMEFYYLGFGSYASQSVFKNEVQYIAGLMDDNFDWPDHSIQLINHRDTIDDYPLAVGYNIDIALRGIATKMNVDEDLLLFYLTTHGSKDHELSVRFSPLRLTNINPAMLKGFLDNEASP